MRFLRLSSLWLIMLACSTGVQAGQLLPALEAVDTISENKNGFGGSFEKGLYKSVLDISSHHLSGFIFLKRTSDSTYRILFSNQIGMTFFDFEISENQLTVHYCFPSLYKGALIKLLRQNFHLLLFPFSGIKSISPIHATNETTDFKVKSSMGKWNYRIFNSSGRIIRIDSKGKIVGKTRIGINYTKESPSLIEIINPTISLRLKMELIN